ncbi:ABC transporter ATP-binding protein [Pseudoxanthomonas kalamensis]|uniref:ABC transporter ATP-binding protein n=1 Tax=Pseudoxanthomonas kalamensis TaxID=289483 RepID=UPI0013909189|nr:ATP-binding cassette domain-containing protein [Pseudoxanthomonas kalamensis]
MSVHIRVRNLSLEVPAYFQREHEVKGWGSLFRNAAFSPPQRRLVKLLDSVSLDIGEGDRLAILGRNGAGKSTLLRVLNGVYRPTNGSIEIFGSCQALLNMALGFNGYATVRENIILRGVAMGMKSALLKAQMESILEFAGLAHKANHLLRTLSSGQRMRLGFAISTSVQHDIMLMDEWVGTGDANFMAQAKERMRSRVGGSKVVVLASHSVGLLRDICNKGIVLEGGRLIHAGDIVSSLRRYHELLAELRENPHADAMLAEGGGGSQAETAARTYGVVESVIAQGDGRFLVKGWMVDTEGALPKGLALQVDGQRYLAESYERVSRPDVVGHLGLSQGECGFRAEVMVPGALRIWDLGKDFRVLGGDPDGIAGTSLRLAAGVMHELP